MEIGDSAINLVGGQHLSAGRIDLQDNRFYSVVVFGSLELRLDHIHQAVAALVGDAAGDDPIDLDDRNFICRIIVFGDDLLEFGTDGAGMRTFAMNQVTGKMPDVA